MTQEHYLALFDQYGLADSKIYLIDTSENPDDVYNLFDAVCDAITEPTPYNRLFPQEFVNTMVLYRAGDPRAVGHFDHVDHRAFYLSDLYDYIMLHAKGARKVTT